jgi:nitrogen-specific signal transduction histidine kinase
VDERTRELAAERDRAEAANRAKTRFLANMSHDLRTPLNAVLGYAGLLRRAPRLGADERRQSELIERSGRHLLRLIEDLLDIAEIEYHRLRPVLRDCALLPMLHDLAAVTEREARAKGLGFAAELAPNLPALVCTDERRVRQVLQNLLDNAVKYTDAGRVRLHVTLAPQLEQRTAGQAAAHGPVLLFEVSDTGRGIKPADHQRLFDPFEQYHPSQQGNGLGLAICRELTTLLDGTLTLDSAPGGGSTFRLRLPEPGAAAALGFDGFVLKPIEPTQLYSVLGRCLRLRWTSANSTVEPPAMPVASAAACPAARSDQPQSAWPLPPVIELEAGAELAEHGDWPALRDWCAELACSDPSYEAFATRVLDLVAALEHGDRKAEGGALLDLLAGRER